MKFAVLGAGGVGGIVGAYLALAGNDLTFIARGAHLAAIKEKGFLLRTSHRGDIPVPTAKACASDEYDDTPDVIFVCFKYYSLPDAIEFVRRHAGKETLVIPLLNVFGTGEVMQKELPDATVLDGCVYIYGMVESPGIVAQPAPILRIFYGYRPKQERRLESLAKELEPVLQAADIDGHFTENIRREALQKFSYVSPLGAAGLYFDAVSGDFLREGEPRKLFIGLIEEIEALGRSMGIQFEKSLVDVNLKLMDSFTKDLKTSMQRDVAHGGPSEFDGLVHRVSRLGKEYHVATPLYDKISAWGKEKGIC
ncbi:MAG: 2-dehydropantoate 2-reductase [Selenomonadaceae bacterium]|nr:2-dehydropantoate 2-reductase [Selenomonadaceae bacterium]